MNKPIRWALAFTTTLWALAAAAAEQGLPPSAALTDATLHQLNGQKAPLLRYTWPDQITPNRDVDRSRFDPWFARKTYGKRGFEKPRSGGCIAIYPPPSNCQHR